MGLSGLMGPVQAGLLEPLADDGLAACFHDPEPTNRPRDRNPRGNFAVAMPRRRCHLVLLAVPSGPAEAWARQPRMRAQPSV